MALSGVEVLQECMDAYKKIKTDKERRFAVFKVSEDKKTIGLDFLSPLKTECIEGCVEIPQEKDEPIEYTFFRQKMTQHDGCRYGVFDLEWKQKDITTGKIVFFIWCPDSASVSKKMMYSTSKDALKKKLDGVQVHIQANDADELSFAEVIKSASKGKAI